MKAPRGAEAVPPARTERRSAERRQGDRRHAGAVPAAPADPGVGVAHAGPLPRILRTYLAARAALGLALVLLPLAAALLVGGTQPLPMLAVSLLYAGQAVSLWLLRGARVDRSALQRLPRRPWLLTIGVDLLAFALMRLLDPAPQLNLAALLVLPVLMAGVLSARVPALATAALAALVLLASVWVGQPHEGDIVLQLSQAGLAGAGMFLISLLASEMAQRLAGEERSARHSLALARRQTQLNRVVIEEMAEGVLVVDRQGRLQAANPAALQLIDLVGAPPSLPCPLADVPALAGLQPVVSQAYAQGRWPDDAREQQLRVGNRPLPVQVRARFTRRRGIGADGMPPEDIAVLFIEDLRTVRLRQRQDKLAAMGRVSAGIAHEIRNPLAAIAQANALMLEDPLPEGQQRLARIVSDNVARLKRIVDDVLAVNQGGDYQPVAIDASSECARICTEWFATMPPGAQVAARVDLQLPAVALRVQFDAEHLRRVLVNLLDNAVRHAGPLPGAVRVQLEPEPAGQAVRLSVCSDGEPVPPEVERHLFEPFSSSRSRGSGLGLYICRELCERHGASIDYLVAAAPARHRNVFSVLMRKA